MYPRPYSIYLRGTIYQESRTVIDFRAFALEPELPGPGQRILGFLCVKSLGFRV